MRHDWSLNVAKRQDLSAALSHDSSPLESQADVVCSHNEVNDRHGTGILIQRLFPAHRRNVVSFRGASHWDGEQHFGALQFVIPADVQRTEIYKWTLDQISGLTVRHIYCIPFRSAEIHAALALRDAYQAPFCLYIMDDQNVASDEISDELMAEAINKSTLRLAVSSDMRDAYQAKYDRKFWIAPPTVPEGVSPPIFRTPRTGHAVIVGNIWAQEWLDSLTEATGASAFMVDWYCNAPDGGAWLDPPSIRKLALAGVRLREPLPPQQLASQIGNYEVALIPTVPETGRRENYAVASLSLPSRLSFLIGASDLPIIVLGDPATCVARFVKHFGLGVISPYRGEAITDALNLTRDPHWRAEQTASLRVLRRILSNTDIANWVRTSLVKGAPVDQVFEALDVKPSRFMSKYYDDATSLGPWLHTYDPIHAALGRMKASGYKPNFIIDAGASTGVWSYAASLIFPAARFVLVEPLVSRHDQPSIARFTSRIQDWKMWECALGESDGEGSMMTDSNLYGGALRERSRVSHEHEERVVVRSLDSLSGELALAGRGILKLDIQGGELDALKGGRQLITDRIDALVLEVTIDPPDARTPSYDEVHALLREMGFTLYDDVGMWRDPKTGALLEKDVLYVKQQHPLAQARRAKQVQ